MTDELRTCSSMSQQINIQDKVFLERATLFFGYATGNMSGALMGGILIGIVLFSSGTQVVFIAYWLALILAFSFLTYLVELSFNKVHMDIILVRSWLIRRILSGTLVATMYGVSPFLLTPEAGVEAELFLFIILLTMVAVASISYTVMPVYYLILNAICLTPITINFLRTFDTIHIAMVVTSVICQLFILKKALHVSRTTIDALFTNERLQHEVEERNTVEHALRESEERFKTLSHAAFEGVIIIEGERIIDANYQCENITGYNRTELIDKNIFDIIADESAALVKKNIAKEDDLPYEITAIKKNKKQITLEVRGKKLAYKGKKLLVVVVRDITRHKQLEKKLETLATTDALTGIANRHLGLLFLNKHLKSAKREGSCLTICFIDVDGLKLINDKYGHNMGDDLIKSSSILLAKVLRETDLICRLGGDEFLLIFPNCTVKQASEIWNRICEEVQYFNSTSEKPYQVSFSHGFSEFDPYADISSDELISMADNEMYKVKKAKNGIK